VKTLDGCGAAADVHRVTRQCSPAPTISAPGHIHKEAVMFDHVGFGVSNLAESKAFYLKALRPLGVEVAMEGPHGVGMGRHKKPALWLFETQERPAHLHLAFTADTRAQVDEFYSAALAAGGTDNGAPGLRPHYHANYYGAFVIGPNGHNVEAVCHQPEA
jgi:catechol 2,3-dioxygenase-like lactoylglutathione lyase family enzyme